MGIVLGVQAQRVDHVAALAGVQLGDNAQAPVARVSLQVGAHLFQLGGVKCLTHAAYPPHNGAQVDCGNGLIHQLHEQLGQYLCAGFVVFGPGVSFDDVLDRDDGRQH